MQKENNAIYTKLGADSCAQAQNNLAIAYYNGNGVEENKDEALKLFKVRAADSSMVNARYNLALAYMQDDGPTSNEILPLLTEALTHLSPMRNTTWHCATTSVNSASPPTM